MRKIFIAIIAVLQLSVAARAQEPARSEYEYGRPAELRGLTKFYIDAGADLENRNRILDIIEKELPALRLVESADEAEFAIIFAARQTERVTGALSQTYPNGSSATLIGRRKFDSGRAVVATFTPAGRLRLLLSFSAEQDAAGEKKPAVKFAKQFVKAYKKANGSK